MPPRKTTPFPVPVFSLPHTGTGSTRHTKLFATHVEKCDVALLIALRRTILAEVETVAVAFDAYDTSQQDITVHHNSGCLHNEWLCHRVSMLPIHLTKDEIAHYDPNEYEFKISRSADGTRDVDVTTKDIVVMRNNKRDDAAARRLFPPSSITGDHVWLTRLRWSTDTSREKIDLTFTARRGTGRQHARWSPASLCAYRAIVDEELRRDTRDALVSLHGETSRAVKNFDVLEYQRCFFRDDKGDPSAFCFAVESECGLSGFDIFDRAFCIVREQIAALEPHFSTRDEDDRSFVNITFPNDVYTVVALIQAIGYELCVRDARSNTVTFIGCHQPHPLQDAVVLKLRHTLGDDHRAALASILGPVQKWLDDAYDSFQKIPKNDASRP